MTIAADDRDSTIAELRARLADAEDTLAAIRNGDVDALVVRSADVDQVFMIEGDGQSYRTFMEAMDTGASAVDSRGNVLYANRTALSLLRKPLSAVQGHPLRDSFDDSNSIKLDELLNRSSSSRHSTQIAIADPSGAEFHYMVSATPLRVGTVTGHAVTFADVTERVRAEAAEQSERAARAVIASANEAVLVCDRDGVVTHANAAARSVSQIDPVGRHFREAVPLVFPSATGLVQAEDIVEMAIGGTAVQGIEAVASDAPTIKDYLVSAAPLRVAADQISGCVVTMVDLTQRKAAEKHQLLLMAELDHRVKNTLALVMSISTRTLSSEDTLDGFHKAFTGRIQALAATHNLLADRSWSNLRLKDVITSEFAPFVEQSAGRVHMHGLDLSVAPRAAIAVGLIVHELTTNAVKYGALSNDAGAITITALETQPDSQSIEFMWTERGGPRVDQPKRRGFGRTVIARSLQYSPHGSCELLFEPEGVTCKFAIPIEDLAEDRKIFGSDSLRTR